VAGGWRGPTTDPLYAELHCHSNFSFLDGASHPEELVAEAARLGLGALALTDHDGLYGVVRFSETARAVGLASVFGAELTLVPSGSVSSPVRTGAPDPVGTHLVVLARDPDGYARLSRAIAEAHLAGGTKGTPTCTLDDLGNRHGGIGWSSPAAARGRSPPLSPAPARPPPLASSSG
jgi:error-prone DNA polymerase